MNQETIPQVAVVGNLAIGQPNTDGHQIGVGYVPETLQQQADVAAAAAEATRPLTKTNAAFCIDGRKTIKLGEITDPEVLNDIVAPQLPGGTNLAATKAAVAANAVIVRNAANFDEAYDIVTGVLTRAGYEDAGHEGCGASKKMKKTVEDPVDVKTAYANLKGLGVAKDGDEAKLEAIAANKHQRVENGFYDSWDPGQHEAKIKATAPQNYAILETSADATSNHHEGGAYSVSGNNGFAKNDYIDKTGGKQLFAYTHAFAKELAGVLAGSPEEARMIELGFGDDLLDVSNQLIAAPDDQHPGLAVIA